jgi:hypothetical protein
MTYTPLRVEKLTPHVGAEVHGVDLARPLDERTPCGTTSRSDGTATA